MSTQRSLKKIDRFGLVSDTHDVPTGVIAEIVAKFIQAQVHAIIHCGDIESKHVDAELWGNLPVICALVDDQHSNREFVFTPANWAFTRSGDRVRNFGSMKAYVGHKRSFGAITQDPNHFNREIDEIAKPHNGLRLIASGHTHNQLFFGRQNAVFMNPGAVIESLDQCTHEYGMYNHITGEATFSRILKETYASDPVTIGIIAETSGVSVRNVGFWKRIAEEFKSREVKIIIHCGLIDPEDIGTSELSDFLVFYPASEKIQQAPSNWQAYSPESPVIKIEPFNFLVQHDLGLKFMRSNGYDTEMWFTEQIEKYGKIDFALSGLTRMPLLEENLYGMLVCPGSALSGQKFVTIKLPTRKITFGNIPFTKLPY